MDFLKIACRGLVSTYLRIVVSTSITVMKVNAAANLHSTLLCMCSNIPYPYSHPAPFEKTVNPRPIYYILYILYTPSSSLRFFSSAAFSVCFALYSARTFSPSRPLASASALTANGIVQMFFFPRSGDQKRVLIISKNTVLKRTKQELHAIYVLSIFLHNLAYTL